MTDIWYRFNTVGESALFQYRNYIDGIIMPAHLLSFYDPSLYNFLNDSNLPFIIDPMTYIWGRSIPGVKKSYIKYVNKLNCNIGNILGKENILYCNYSDIDLNDFVNKVLAFQYNTGNITQISEPRQKSLSRIRQKKQKSTILKKPSFLIPPYFYFNSTSDEAYNLTKRSSELALSSQYNPLSTISPCLCMSRDVLYNHFERSQIIQDFKDYKWILFWINEYDDRQNSTQSLNAIKNLIIEFSQEKVNTINLFGSYFSILMGYYGLKIGSSGISISHKKNIDSVASGGGLPLRYYEPTLKMEILNTDAFRLYSDFPELFICDCPFCQSYSSKNKQIYSKEEREEFLDPFFIEIREKTVGNKTKVKRPAIMDWTKTRIHFMHNRNKEKNDQLMYTKEQTILKLKEDYNKLNKLIDSDKYSKIDLIAHIKNWYESLES